jgi:hypothetical protein
MNGGHARSCRRIQVNAVAAQNSVRLQRRHCEKSSAAHCLASRNFSIWLRRPAAPQFDSFAWDFSIVTVARSCEHIFSESTKFLNHPNAIAAIERITAAFVSPIEIKH